MKQFIDINLKVKRIHPSSLYISIDILMIPKKISITDPHIMHDYRELNEKIVKNHISLSHRDEILKLLINVVIHEKIDLVNAYYQILIYSDDIHKTAFKISFRLYE